MKTISPYNATVLLAACTMWVGVADASLINDTVTFNHYFPDSTTSLSGWSATSTVVAAGDGDIVTFYNGYPNAYNVNVEANSILVDYTYLHVVEGTWCAETLCAFGAEVSFNGLGVSSLNDSSGNPLQNVLIDTNMAGWDSSTMLNFGADYVNFDWKGLSFTEATYFNATLEFSAVPLPSAMFLFGSGLIGLIGVARRKKA